MADPNDSPATVVDRPRLADLMSALALLLAWPGGGADIRRAAAARATLFFPVVGGLLGLVLAGIDRLIGDRLPAVGAACLLVALWEGGRAGRFLRAWEVLVRPAIGSIVIVGTIAIKVALLASLDAARPLALVFAPVLAHWAIVVLAVGARDAACPTRKLNPGITFREFALTSVGVCAVVFAIAEAFGVLLVVVVAALTLALRLLQHRRAGGTSWPLLLASAAAIELAVLGVTRLAIG